jgi:3D (Asp-Asp-Asp) domain-containing protein
LVSLPFLRIGAALALAPVLLSPSSPAAAAGGIRLEVDGRVIDLPRTGDTVREALEDAGVTLDADDEVSPTLESTLADGASVRVRRVRFVEREVEARIPFRTAIRPTTRAVNPYHPTVLKEGRSGLKRLTYRVKMVDGVEVEKSPVAEVIVREPVTQVVIARKPAQLGSRGAYVGKRTFTMVATAYDPGPGSCGRFADGKTANGKRAGYGIIAVDPKVIPLGSKLYVPGYGYGIAADVGSAIKGNHVDLGFNSRSGAKQWGKRRVSLEIVE